MAPPIGWNPWLQLLIAGYTWVVPNSVAIKLTANIDVNRHEAKLSNPLFGNEIRLQPTAA